MYILTACIVNVSFAGSAAPLRAIGAASAARGPHRGPCFPYLNALSGHPGRNAPLLSETNAGDVPRGRFRGIRFHRWRIAMMRPVAYLW